MLRQKYIYIPSEEKYVDIIEFSSWQESDLSEYYGEYLYIMPSENEFGEYNGSGYYEKYTIFSDSLNNSKVQIIGEIDGSSEPEIDTLIDLIFECQNENINDNYCYINSDLFNGRFVIFKYKNDSHEIKQVRGILVVNQLEESDYFYERKK